ncbi:testis-specific serine/threonine-protein kinase 3-like [Anopheles marshallii]|uniref:testis-specific serine/threonine-protein kinase 3-like n=1 Tax=Anopheles marshallii TaxID=1521116 RepID=UPI00237B8F27|nr:testis-specific serine/threonine-protein kinase 3-like [Anopheles marshallii]
MSTKGEQPIPSSIEALGYRWLKRISEGAFSKVHLAEYHNRRMNCIETVACKLIDTKRCSEKFRKRFLPRELTILLHVRHPYIIRIHAIVKCRSKICIFMRYAEMGDLLSFVIEHGPLGEPQTRIWCRQLALAVQYLHESGIAHRDLKCENVLLSANLNVKLSDFGFARYVAEKNRQPQLSTTFCGSFDYSAPELLKGKPYNPKSSDLWALGVVLYMLLNKSVPFKGKTRQVYEQQLTRAWKFRSRVNDALSPEVKTLVRSLLEPNPMIRWTIEKVLVCDWLIQDRRLRSLNAEEFSALAEARIFARSSADMERVKEKLRLMENTEQSVTMIKETGSKLSFRKQSDSLISQRASLAEQASDSKPRYSK